MSRKFMTSLGLEDFDNAEEITQEEAEVQAEEIEVADAETEIVDEAEDLGEFVEQADDIEAEVEEMEILEEEVETALEEDNLEAAEVGLEALRGRHRSLQRRHGFDFSGLLDSVSKESIGANPRHRRTNIQHGLEKFSDSIKKVWEAIKNAFKKAWNWLKEFMTRYFTELGRLEASITKLKKTVRDIKGAPKTDGEAKAAPGGLQKLYYNDGNVDSAAVLEGMAIQVEATDVLKGILTAFANSAKAIKGNATKEKAQIALSKSVEAVTPIIGKDTKFGSQDKPLVTGWFGELKGSVEGSGDDRRVKFELVKDKRDFDTSDKRKFIPGDKSALTSVLDKAENLVKVTKAIKTDFDRDAKDFDDALSAIDKIVESKDKDGENTSAGNAVSILSRNFQGITKNIPGVISTIAGLNTRAIAGGVQFVGASLKTYSTDDKK